MATWKSLKPEQKAAAGQLFDALSTLDVLADASARAVESRGFGFAELYAYATERERSMDAPLRRALESDSRLRDVLERILDNTALYRFPLVAAASAGALDGREGEGFRIRLRPSRAEKDQTYVIIEVTNPAGKVPSTLFVKGLGESFEKYPLPPAQDGVIQLLAEANSELVKALRDVHTEVFIR